MANDEPTAWRSSVDRQQPPAEDTNPRVAGDESPAARDQRQDQRREQNPELGIDPPVVNQRSAADRRREQERDLGLAERECRACSRPQPIQRDEHHQQQRRRAPRPGAAARSGTWRRARRARRPGRRSHSAKDEEVDVGDPDHGADEIFRLLEPQEARDSQVLERCDPQIEQRIDRGAHGLSLRSARRADEYFLEAHAGFAVAELRRHLGDRAVRDLRSALQDQHVGADLLEQMQQVRAQDDRRARARALARSMLSCGECRAGRDP